MDQHDTNLILLKTDFLNDLLTQHNMSPLDGLLDDASNCKKGNAHVQSEETQKCQYRWKHMYFSHHKV